MNKKTDNSRLKYRITVGLNSDQYYQFKEEAFLHDMSLSRYIRYRLLLSENYGVTLTGEQDKTLLELVKILRPMSNNLNQAQRVFNSKGYRNEEASNEAHKLAQVINKLLKEFDDKRTQNFLIKFIKNKGGEL